MDITIRFGDQVVVDLHSNFAPRANYNFTRQSYSVTAIDSNGGWSGGVENVVPQYTEVTSGLWTASVDVGTSSASTYDGGPPAHISADYTLVTILDFNTRKELVVFPISEQFPDSEQMGIVTDSFYTLGMITQVDVFYVKQQDGSWQTAVTVWLDGQITPKH